MLEGKNFIELLSILYYLEKVSVINGNLNYQSQRAINSYVHAFMQ